MAETTGIKFKTVEQYIDTLSAGPKRVFKEMRKTIKEVLPKETEELISYNMPAFRLNKKGIVCYAAWKEHIALYPLSGTLKKAFPELADYEGGKGTIRFPYDKPLPLALIQQFIKFRVKENKEEALAKAKKKK
jgi:uncharacterized protein YdhG (YjbR/CyaY superfamily)